MMKKIILAILMVILGALTVVAQQLPNLRGDEAIENLKQNGQYASLMEALKAARRENGQTEGTTTENAVGQWVKFSVSDDEPSDDSFSDVSISGDTAIVGVSQFDVGANTDQGAAFVFVRSGTTWIRQQLLTASDGTARDQFGEDVAISGDTLIVGAMRDNVGANTSQGSAYVFVRSGRRWIQQQKLTASDGASLDLFGDSVAILGDTAIVGANRDSAPLSRQGSVYVFIRNGATWTQQQKLTASDAAANDNFGSDVAIAGDRLIIGANGDDTGNNMDHGAAYIFIRSGAAWIQEQKLTLSNSLNIRTFGSHVAISGDTVVIGVPSDNVGGNINQGSAFVFVRNSGGWIEQQKLTASEGAPYESFGISVGISGDTIIVGAWQSSVVGRGRAYVFTRSGTTWTQRQKLDAADENASVLFGMSVAISGSNIIVGGTRTAFLFRLLSDNWIQESQRAAADGANGDSFGFSVAISGNTAVVGAPYDDVGANSNQGTVYVFAHSETGWALLGQLNSLAVEAAANDNFGSSVAIFGNLIFIGSPGDDDYGRTVDRGAAYIFERFDTFLVRRERIRAFDGAPGDRFGSSIAFGISGISFAIIGAPGDDIGANADQGSAYVFSDESSRWAERHKLIASDGAAGDQFGSNVNVSINIFPTYVTHLIVGAEMDDVGANSDQGSVYVFSLSGYTITQQQKLTASDGAANDRFGNSLASNQNTLIVGAYQNTVGANDGQGSAYVFFRNGTNWTERQQLTAADGAPGDQFGKSVSINAEIVTVGAWLDDIGANADQGSAYVFQRSGATWVQIQKLTSANGAAGDQFGSSVTVNGDKIVAGAPFADISASDKGAAFFFIDFVAPASGAPAKAMFDYDGDGKTDVSVFRPSNGIWYVRNSSDLSLKETYFGLASDKIVPADYDGDGKTDIAVFREGWWYLLQSTEGFSAVYFGSPGDKPQPADYDGDGKADVAVFRPSNGTWYLLKSRDGFAAAHFGISNDRPVAADYDGDGKADLAVYRDGFWYLLRSRDGFLAVNFGVAEDKPVAGDYDGDGKTDVAVWRPSKGDWYYLRSTDNGFNAFHFGSTGDVPAPGDYDGDGKNDFVVFRPSHGNWYLLNSISGSMRGESLGISQDLPTPAAIIP